MSSPCRDEINDKNTRNVDERKWGPPFENTEKDLHL